MTGSETKFDVGRIVVTAAAGDALRASGADASEFVTRHQSGDFGDLGPEDWFENEFAVQLGQRVFSCFTTSAGQRLWVITEADRSSTCVAVPEEV